MLYISPILLFHEKFNQKNDKKCRIKNTAKNQTMENNKQMYRDGQKSNGSKKCKSTKMDEGGEAGI